MKCLNKYFSVNYTITKKKQKSIKRYTKQQQIQHQQQTE